MPGACTSRRRSSVDWIGPRPSTGRPSGSTTRPSRPSPTGTERMRPVARAGWPSSMCSMSPSTTAPMESSSRFSASPRTPPSNSSSSLTAVFGKPEMCAMPSPTSVMRPTCCFSTSGRKPSRWRRSTPVISSALMLRVVSDMGCEFPPTAVRVSERFSELIEPAADGAVDDGVAHACHDAAEHGRVDEDLQLHLLASGLLERFGEPAALLVVEGYGGPHLRDLTLTFGGRPLHQAIDDLGKLAGTTGAHQERDQVRRQRQRLLVEQVLDDRLALLDGQGLIGELLSQLLVALEQLRELEQLVLDLLERTFGPRDLEDALRVSVDAISHQRALPTWLM